MSENGGRKLFGTDGIRGVANVYPMTAEVALSLGRAVAYVFRKKDHRHKILIGKDTRKLFSVLTSKDSLPGNKTMETKYEPLSADTTLMRWVQFKGTPKEISGYDVFVIRGGKVVFQTVTVNAAKK